MLPQHWAPTEPALMEPPGSLIWARSGENNQANFPVIRARIMYWPIPWARANRPRVTTTEWATIAAAVIGPGEPTDEFLWKRNKDNLSELLRAGAQELIELRSGHREQLGKDGLGRHPAHRAEPSIERMVLLLFLLPA